MSKIDYFQRYHQKENVVTNNTMLLFSRLYHHSPKKFEMFLQSIVDSSIELKIGVRFAQQEKSSKSVPDGIITQHSFKIAIETKLGNDFGTAQLLNHLECFKDEEVKILIALSSRPFETSNLENLKERVKNYNISNQTKIAFVALTFNDVIKAFKEQVNDYDLELLDIIEDFNLFCDNTGLLPKDNPRLLIVPCGDSIRDNFKFRMYYDPVTRKHTRATHLGVYNAKKVQGIAKIANIIEASYDDELDALNIISSENDVTLDQQQRIIDIIKASVQTLGWSIKNGHKFFCLDDLEKTSFRKNSKGGIMGKRYMYIDEITGLNKDNTTKEFAESLNSLTWD